MGTLIALGPMVCLILVNFAWVKNQKLPAASLALLLTSIILIIISAGGLPTIPVLFVLSSLVGFIIILSVPIFLRKKELIMYIPAIAAACTIIFTLIFKGLH